MKKTKCSKCNRLTKRLITLKKQKINLKKAVDLLMEHWDDIHEDDREELDAELKKVGV
jgi:hypothetical protein